MAARRTSKSAKKKQQAKTYNHSDQDALMRPEVGTQAQFRKDKRKPPATYRLRLLALTCTRLGRPEPRARSG